MEDLACCDFPSVHVLGLRSVGFSTAAPCDFRTRSELDRYLEASQIRQRAIERINDVTGTYEYSLSRLEFASTTLNVVGWWMLFISRFGHRFSSLADIEDIT